MDRLYTVVVIFILASVYSNGLYIFNSPFFKSAFAIKTDQTKVVLSTWTIPTSSPNVTSIMSDLADNVYFVESNSSNIGKLVPATNTLTEWSITGHPLVSSNIWALPAKPGKLTGVALDPTTGIYFGESNPNKIGVVYPTNNTFSEWTLPAHSGKLTGVAFDPTSGGIYFAESNPNKIGRLVPKANTFTEWTLPAHSGSPGLRNSVIAVPVPGNTYIYFAESNPNKIGRLVPKTNNLTEWTLPANSGSIFNVTPGPGVYFAESNSNKIGELDPTSSTFTEWTLPAHSGKLTGVAFDPTSGGIYFAESNPNKIGRLVPKTNIFTEWSLSSHPLAIEVSPSGIYFFADSAGRLGRLD